MSAIGIDTESTGLYLHHGCRAFLVTACDDEGYRFHWWFDVDPFTREVIYDETEVLDMYNTLMKYDEWVFHNALFDMTALAYIPYVDFSAAYETKVIHDTILMAHAVNSLLEKGLKPLAFHYLGFPETDESELDNAVAKYRKIAKKLGWAIAEPTHPHLTPLKSNKGKCDFWIPPTLKRLHPDLITQEEADTCLVYGLNDPTRTIGLFLSFQETLRERGFYEAYLKNANCILAVKDMQDQGFSLKLNKINGIRHTLARKKQEIKNRIIDLVGDESFNPDSGKQVAKVLYEDYELPIPKFTEKGSPSTDKDTLEELLEYSYLTNAQDSLIQSILIYRKLGTTSGYLHSYRTHQLDGYIFPSLNIAGTKTLRLACFNPNTQNITKKTPKGYEWLGVSLSLRSLFGPRDGKLWITIDYSQLQLRIFAYACQDQFLINSFEQGLDIHDTVARIVFSTDTPTADQRTAAKNINFGIIFGAGKNKIERMTGMPGSYTMFKDRFPKVDSYLAEQEYNAKKLGYCLTMGGYPLMVPRRTAYKACNYIVQGTEGELVKDAIVRCHEYCKQDHVILKPIMTIHDEIIFETKVAISIQAFNDVFKYQLLEVQQLMRDASASIGVITEVDSKITDNLWSTAV